MTVITFDGVEEPAAAVRPIVDWMAMLELPAPLVVGTTGAVGLEKAPAPLELRAASRNEMPLPAAKPVARCPTFDNAPQSSTPTMSWVADNRMGAKTGEAVVAGAEAGIDHAIVSIGLVVQLTDEFERDARRAQFVLKIFAVAAALGIG